MKEAPFKAPHLPRDCVIPKAVWRERGNVPSLETWGCFRDDVPKTQLYRVYLEILIGVKKLEKVAQGQGSTLTGQSPASAGPGMFTE